MTTESPPDRIPQHVWLVWLLVVATAVVSYAGVLVVDASRTSSLFDALGFGPSDGGVPADPLPGHVRLLYGVLGSVLVGWFVLVAAVVAGPLRRGDPTALPALGLSIGVWFVLDTGFSLAIAEWEHALFNVPFALALGIPLVALAARRRSTRSTRPVVSQS